MIHIYISVLINFSTGMVDVGLLIRDHCKKFSVVDDKILKKHISDSVLITIQELAFYNPYILEA